MSSNWKTLVPVHKYGINEIQKFVNPETQTMFKIDVNWKRGTFSVLINNEENVNYNEASNLYEYFEECYVDSLESGTEEFIFIDMETGEEIEQTEEHAEFIEQYYVEGINFVYDSGYDEELDPELYIEGGFTLEDGEPTYEEEENHV